MYLKKNTATVPIQLIFKKINRKKCFQPLQLQKINRRIFFRYIFPSPVTYFLSDKNGSAT